MVIHYNIQKKTPKQFDGTTIRTYVPMYNDYNIQTKIQHHHNNISAGAWNTVKSTDR